MCDTTNQLPDAAQGFTLTGNSWGGSVSARSCGTCGQLIYAGAAHHCYAVPFGGLSGYPPVYFQPERKPHVCPVCTGKGEVPDGEVAKRCPACKGECVLWG